MAKPSPRLFSAPLSRLRLNLSNRRVIKFQHLDYPEDGASVIILNAESAG